MGFVGEVSIEIFFGTNFDMINVPYDTTLITQTATKHITKTAQVVWQTTWVNEIQINVENYQDIVGAQFVRIIDSGTSNIQAHWYEVITYYQSSKKCVRIGLMYDPLLSIGIQNITGITGTINRHSVSDDTHFKYTFSDEPINQITPYNFNYAEIDSGLILANAFNMVGFPYDMTKQPEIVTYDKTPANATIYVPTLTKLDNAGTGFSPSFAERMSYLGMQFYQWKQGVADTAIDNYGNAVALGYDIVSESYVLPNPGLSQGLIKISYSETNGVIGYVSSSSVIKSSNFSLYESGYNNNKASELGIYFSLYNEFSGEEVTVKNYDITNTNVTLHCDPSPNGSVMARFSTYMKDSTGISGLISSPKYPRYNITSNTNYMSATNTLNNAISQSVLSTYELTSQQSLQNVRTNARIGNNANMWSSVMNIAGNVANDIMQVAAQIYMGNAVGATTDIVSGLTNNIVAGTQTYLNYTGNNDIINNNYNTGISNLFATIDQQKVALSVQGTLGKLLPPTCKYLNSNVNVTEMYSFKVRKTSISNSDRKRADNFFTAYGYNVNKTVLNNPNQLNTRTRFTFIQADDVKITSVQGDTDNTRIEDLQTINYIQNRFASGIRIWQITPNLDWSIANPIRG
jgi:hypothetical protein